MFFKRMICLLLTLFCVAGLTTGALAAETECDSAYCFSVEDFGRSALAGICITGLPDANAGTVMLGRRVLRPGDILTAEQVAAMTFVPVPSEENYDAVVTYLPIYSDRVESSATMTIAVRGREDKAPVAQDQAIETYKNLPNQAMLKVNDPEGMDLTYTIIRQPKRGEVTIGEDGSFTYTPKKNKVGTDSFVYTAADPGGNVSREATVTIRILKPTDARQYQDTTTASCRFAAEWMKNTGIFTGEQVGGMDCFQPEKAVTRGEFLTMLIKTLDLPVDADANVAGVFPDAPNWLMPYLAAALRSGITTGLPCMETSSFDPNVPITGAEAAVMLQNVMDLAVVTVSPAEQTLPAGAKETMEGPDDVPVEETDAETAPVWAQNALAALECNGISLPAGEALNRGQVAELLYQVSGLSAGAPGMLVYQ